MEEGARPFVFSVLRIVSSGHWTPQGWNFIFRRQLSDLGDSEGSKFHHWAIFSTSFGFCSGKAIRREVLSQKTVLTQNNLMRRGIPLCSRCFFCGKTADYTGRSLASYDSWEEAGKQSKNRNKWRIVPASMWWAIWKERNSGAFQVLGKKLLRWKERKQLQKKVWRERFRRVEKEEEERVEAN
ncbi:hypothetical protein H5410_047646 [Solanum commersonii]|uniref:Uncharacterized protein n=1 Tax=Solanum commersonii TaxID=4109 RepID=A0A9J5XIW2_SOLCO|nr:hypothetical protein H5410_047646 [Solanum commersonii]